jgi:hypothetical protein
MRSLMPSRLRYLHLLPHAKRCNCALRKLCKNTIKQERKEKTRTKMNIYDYILMFQGP